MLRHSSLDTDIKDDTDRFDERIDGSILPQRDEYDKKVSQATIQLTKVLENLFSERVVNTKLPYSHKRAVHNIFALEIRQYMVLTKAMSSDVSNLRTHIDGKYMKPLEIEKLWS